jgi:dihydropyrimidine dehydrogenase (NAD+) subunit PreA
MVKRDDGTQQLTWDERTQNDDIPVTFDDDRAGGKHHFVPKPSDALKPMR